VPILSLSAVVGDFGDVRKRKARRVPGDHKWFVEPLRSTAESGQQTYFEETWGDIMEEERRKRSHTRDNRPESETASKGRRGEEPEGDETNRRVQEMLEHVDSEAEDSEEQLTVVLAPSQEPVSSADDPDYGEAPRSEGTSAGAPSAPGTRPPRERSSHSGDAPRCGSRASSLRSRPV